MIEEAFRDVIRETVRTVIREELAFIYDAMNPTKFPGEPDFLTKKRAMELAGNRSYEWVNNHIETGELEVVNNRITKRSLEAYLNKTSSFQNPPTFVRLSEK